MSLGVLMAKVLWGSKREGTVISGDIVGGVTSTSGRSGGAFFMPLGLPHAAKSFCVNDLLGNIG